VTETPARAPSVRWWRIAAGALAAILILAAALLGALRLLVAHVPENAGRVQAWVEQQTHLRIEYQGLDARLRWFGPEIVLRDVRVLDRDGTQALFETREGSVGLDVWNFFRTGQIVAGRVRFLRPDITVVRLPDGRIRLLGQRERPADEPPFDLDRLPAGRVSIEDARVTYRDLKQGKGPWTLDHLQLTLQRDRQQVTTSGYAQLPPQLGGRLDFSGRLSGSLDDFDRLRARVELRVDRLRLAGWNDFLPPFAARARGGEGSATALVAVADGALQQARLDLELGDVALELPARELPPVAAVEVSKPYRAPGESAMHLALEDVALVDRPARPLPRVVRYPVLAGEFRLRRDGDGWQFRLQDLRTDRVASRLAGETRVAGRLRGKPVTTFDLVLDVHRLRTGSLWPLVLAYAPPAFDRWAGLDPQGEIRSLHLEMGRTRAGAAPAFTLSGDVVGLGVSPIGTWPGVSGVTAVLSGTDERGKLALRTQAAALDWPRLFRWPIALEQASADIDWRRDGTVFVIGTRNAQLRQAKVRADGSFELRIPRKEDSPVLDLDASVEGSDAGVTPQYLPVARLKPRTLAWLDRAFVKGKVSNGRFSYHGPVRKFPFRNGEGEFSASADVSDLTLDYFEGFAPLTGASGRVEFRNAGMTAKLQGGEIAGLTVTAGDYTVADFREPLMLVNATGTGDVGKAFDYLQASPLGPTLGRFVMGLSGSGPTDFKFALTLPHETPDGPPVQTDYRVIADLKGVVVNLPALRAPAQQVTGRFDLHNLEINAPSLRGTLLGGPFEASIAPGARNAQSTAAIEFKAHGRAAGTQLPAFIGLPSGVRMNGGADWDLKGRAERRGAGGDWPLRIDVASTLAGLEILAPQPFAKAAADARPTRVRIEVPSNGVNDIAIETGSARARLRFMEGKDGKWLLERGLARFDGQPAVLPSRPGLLVAGDWPQFDLAEWLALGSGSDSGPRLSEWLGPVDVHLDQALVAGFEFRDVLANLRYAAGTWQVGLHGPMAEGAVVIPEDIRGGKPIELQMQRLNLQSPAAPAGAAAGEPADPRTMPALTVRADDFTWQSRRFGSVQAVIVKVPTGLRFDTLTATAPSFTITAQGSWMQEGAGSRTRLGIELASTDLAATAEALGYREAVAAKRANLKASVEWPGGPSADAIGGVDGKLHLAIDDGTMLNVKPGASGRMLGLMSVVELPRRLALDFRDVTEKGLAFDKIRGDFDLRQGNAYTQNLILKGPAVDIGVAGRTGLATEDYDQTLVVSGNPSGPLTVAGALAGGPVGAAGALVISQLFKGQLQGLTRAYYHVTGPWSNPVVERIAAPPNENAAAGDGAQKSAGAGP
jgi:uncharacterized protein (TIGR02099 family)